MHVWGPACLPASILITDFIPCINGDTEQRVAVGCNGWGEWPSGWAPWLSAARRGTHTHSQQQADTLRKSCRCVLQDARGTSAKHGLADAITRANLYTEAGADAALVEGPRSTYELSTIANHTMGVRAVSISEGGLTPSHSYQQLKEMGFGLVCYGAGRVVPAM